MPPGEVVEETTLPGEVVELSAAAPRATAATVPLANLIHSIVVTPPTPNTVAFNSNVEITASYKTNEAGGVRIFFRPMTGSKLTPNYSAHGSPLYSVGDGTATGSFTITSGKGKVKVTKIRCQMLNDEQSVLLYQAFVPVVFNIR